MVRVGINGLGRIGRTFWRVCHERADIDVVAVNDLADPRELAYLIRYDSVRGRLPARVAATDRSILVDDVEVSAWRVPEAGGVPWGDLRVDVVLEATGRYLRADEVRPHLDAGAGRVVISTATVDPDATVLMGITDDRFEPDRHRIISPACCTSNAVAPVIAVLRRDVALLGGSLTTVHAYDSTKSALHDSPHRNPRMGRAAGINLVPAALKAGTLHALGAAFPELAGRVTGLHVRVPLAVGCLADLVLRFDGSLTAEAVNAALASAAAGDLKGVLGYTNEAIVSSDILRSQESVIVDGEFTRVIGDCVKVVGWYDNEWGFANRLADVVGLVG